MTRALPPDFRDDGILPHAEIVRLAAKYPKARDRGGREKRDAQSFVTLTDVANLMGMGRATPASKRRNFFAWVKGDPAGFTRYRRKQLSKILLQLEEGRYLRTPGKITLLPEPTKKPETVLRLVLAEKKIAGRTVLTHTIVRGEQLPGSRSMPPFKSFALGSKG